MDVSLFMISLILFLGLCLRRGLTELFCAVMYRIIHSDAHLYESLYRDHEPMYFKLALSTTASAY